ncbi:hypothetical protein A2Y85_03355 [candidate division WOR-3 bacterium RBG_13_43_14]|uniref:Gingipain domain-containing protein n=1 Tax=candidate division WOR-3 bacterium RBG_13_43_14 TaxID=1802590 RepID=A0A1F4UA87_UNCW3|nr:MAG: hypothetical protein A2Y85_03355 [candidate division WOR-3 bacterium RBG_13_43_14]
MIVTLLTLFFTNATIIQDITFDKEMLIITKQNEYVRISYPGCDFTDEIGAPELPAKAILVALPYGAKILDVRVLSNDAYVFEPAARVSYVHTPVILCRTDIDLVDRPDLTIYDSDELYPGNIVNFIGASDIDNYQLCELIVHPVQYQPRANKIIFSSKITIAIDYEGGIVRTARTGIVAELVINPENVILADPQRSRSMNEYVIITNTTLDTVFQRLADWKTKKGVPAIVRTTNWIYSNYSGEDNPARIRNYLKTLPDSNTKYVLLAGDTGVIPCRFAYAMSCSAFISPGREDTMPADLYYADLQGTWNFDNDGSYGEIEDSINLYPDLYVGRAPVASIAEAQRFVAKILQYERNPNTSYHKKAVLAADVLWSNPYTDQGVHKNQIEQRSIPPDFTVTKLYDSQGTLSPAAVKNSLRLGQSLFNHDGHGWIDVMGAGTGNLRNIDFDTLTNEPYFGICVSIGCWTAAYDYECIAESFVNSQHGGGIAFIGNSSYGWGSPGNPGFGYSDRFDSRVFHSLLVEDNFHIGDALALAKAFFIPYSREKNVYRWHQYQMNLLGDPEMPVYTSTPVSMNISHPQVVPIGTSSILITVKDAVTGEPIKNALVCLMKGSESYGAGHTDASGTIFIPTTPSSAGNMDLTVTAHNYLTIETSIPVITGSYVNYRGWSINDSLGNNDGIANPNEEIYLDVVLKNTGSAAANNVVLVLSTPDPRVTILDSTENIAVINVNDSLYINNAFHIDIDTASNGHGIAFDLEITDAVRTLNYAPTLLIGTPILELDDVYVVNPPSLPGQTKEIRFIINNRGYGCAHHACALLSESDPYISVVQDSAYYGDIPPEVDSIVLGPYTVSISSSIPAGHHPSLTLSFQAVDYSASANYSLIVGSTGFADNLETGSSKWTTGGTSNRWHISTYRCFSATHAWYCGDSTTHRYSNSMNCYIQTLPFMIDHNSSLSFYRWLSVPLYGSDGIYVIVTGNGINDTLDFIGTGGALEERAIQSDWMEEKYSLSDYSPGETLQIRIAFKSDNDGDIGEGFYIDDVNVQNAFVIEVAEHDQNSPNRLFFDIWPNPFRRAVNIHVYQNAQPINSSGTLSIYDCSGRLVNEFAFTVTGELLPITVHWNGTDRAQRPVPAGVYFIQCELAGATAIKKAVLMR